MGVGDRMEIKKINIRLSNNYLNIQYVCGDLYVVVMLIGGGEVRFQGI